MRRDAIPSLRRGLDGDAAGCGACAEDVDASGGEADAVETRFDGFLRNQLPEDGEEFDRYRLVAP